MISTLGLIGDAIGIAFINIVMWLVRGIFGIIDWIYQVFLAICSARVLNNEQIQTFCRRIETIIGIIALFVVAFVIIKAIVNPNDALKNTSDIFKKLITTIIMLALFNTVFSYMYDFQNAILEGNIIGKIVLGGHDYSEIADTANAITGELDEENNSETTANNVLSIAGTKMALDVFSSFFNDTYGLTADVGEVDENGLQTATYDDMDDDTKCYYYAGDGEDFSDDSFEIVEGEMLPDYAQNKNQCFYRIKEPSTGWGAWFGTIVGGVGTVIAIALAVPTGGISLGVAGLLTAGGTVAGFIAGNGIEDYFTNSNFYSLDTAYTYALINQDFSIYNRFAPVIQSGMMEFHWFMALIAGLYLVYILISFAIDMAVRSVKIAFYQIIAPIPILTRLIPGKETIFNNWLKSTITTFVEVFLKIAIVFFGIYIIIMLPDLSVWGTNSDLFSTNYVGSASFGVLSFARVLVILGILTFIKQAPKLISTMFGLESLSFKGIKDKLSEAAFVGKPIRKGIDAVEGGVSGALGGGLVGLRNGDFKKGLRSGFLAGTAGGGRQFKKQKDKLYHSYNPHDYKGSPGIFGGQSFASKMQEEAGKTNKSIKNDAILNNDKVIAAWKEQAEYMALENTVRSKIMNALENEVRLRENQIQPEIDNLKANINNFEGSEKFRNFMNDPDVIRRANDMAANQLERGYITPEQFDATRTNYEKAYAREKIDSMKNDPIFAKNNPELIEYVENKRRHNELVSELQKVRNQLNDRDAINIKVDSEIERISKKYADGIKEDRDEIRKEYGSIVDENSDLFKAMSRQRATGKAEEEENMVKQYEKWTEAMSKISSGGGSAPTSGSGSSSLDKK